MLAFKCDSENIRGHDEGSTQMRYKNLHTQVLDVHTDIFKVKCSHLLGLYIRKMVQEHLACDSFFYSVRI